MLGRIFKLNSFSADLESWRAISKDPSWLIFKENINFSHLKIATFIRVIFFISKKVSGEISKYIAKFCEEEVGARTGELLLIGEIFSFF